jgi:hypothetical protein
VKLRLLIVAILLIASQFTLAHPQLRDDKSIEPLSFQQDSFVLEHQRRRVENREGLSFEVRLKNNKSQFHAGEIIQLELSFASSKLNTYKLDAATYDRGGRVFGDSFVVDQKANTTDPLHDHFNSGPLFMGGLRSFPGLTEKPVLINADLNEWVRFDKPGHYRLYVISARVSKTSKSSWFGTDGKFTASNLIEFDIVADDETWNAKKLETIVATLNKKNYSSSEHHQACTELRFLGTRAAVPEMVARFDGSDPQCNGSYYLGLIGSPHRDLVITWMEKALVATDHPVATNFVSVLSLLGLVRTLGNVENRIEDWELKNRTREQVTLSYLQQLVAAIPKKKETARAISLLTVLDNHHLLAKNGVNLVSLIAGVPEVFFKLSMNDQSRLLKYQWQPLATDAMTPVLLKAYSQPKQVNEGYELRELRTIALRRLYELSPIEGRRLILEEIKTPTRKVAYETLTILDDKEMPELDQMFLERLESSEDYVTVLALLQRYASRAILPQVRKLYESKPPGSWMCDSQSKFLAYILRVDPETGGTLLEAAIAARGKGLTKCYTSALRDVSQLEMNSAVESVALKVLGDSDSEMVAQATNILREHGTPQIELKLWSRLERWNEENSSNAAQLKKQRRNSPLDDNTKIEQELVQALGAGKNWILDHKKLKRLESLCLTDRCRDAVSGFIAGSQTIYLRTSELPSIRLGRNELKSIDELKTRLMEFPAGSVFTWWSDGKDEPEQTHYKELKRFLEDRGMKLQRLEDLPIDFDSIVDESDDPF